MRPCSLIILGSALLLANSASAAVLAQYSFTGAPGSLLVTTADASVIAADVSFAGGASSQFTTIPNILGVNVDGLSKTAVTAVSTNSFFEVTITPTSGNALNLTSFNFDSGGASIGTGYVVRSSVDAFAANLAAANFATLHPVYSPTSVDLTSSVFQAVSSPVTFRIYTYTPATSPAAVYDNLVINGDVIVVPEPSAAISLLLGSLCLARRRRSGS